MKIFSAVSFVLLAISGLHGETLIQHPQLIAFNGVYQEPYSSRFVVEKAFWDPLRPGSIGTLNAGTFYIFTPERVGTEQSAISDNFRVGLKILLNTDIPGLNVSGYLTRFRFRISAEEAGGWVLVQLNDYTNPGLGQKNLASGQFSGDFPTIHSVEVPLQIPSIYGSFAVSNHANFFSNCGLALYVYSTTGSPGKRIFVGYDLGVDGNLSIEDIGAPNVKTKVIIPKKTRKPKISLHGTVSDYSGVKHLYFTTRGNVRRIFARVRGKSWTVTLPLKIGTNIFYMRAVDKNGRKSRPKLIRITRVN